MPFARLMVANALAFARLFCLKALAQLFNRDILAVCTSRLCVQYQWLLSIADGPYGSPYIFHTCKTLVQTEIVSDSILPAPKLMGVVYHSRHADTARALINFMCSMINCCEHPASSALLPPPQPLPLLQAGKDGLIAVPNKRGVKLGDLRPPPESADRRCCCSLNLIKPRESGLACTGWSALTAILGDMDKSIAALQLAGDKPLVWADRASSLSFLLVGPPLRIGGLEEKLAVGRWMAGCRFDNNLLAVPYARAPLSLVARTLGRLCW
ncbi:hypothetical protein SUGI_1509410 [Cryptomeria japonica]|uniref:Uncharacterized protein n=1 Tax=Cryptomeria japonica TaxID=3369 RepID=A0AAD3NUN4_CRYJA|nr:hypothetical protein SUGI_1509410 [Cryptomeria japonica]